MASGICDKVVIIGMGCTRFGERWDCGPDDLMIEAFDEAVQDASRQLGWTVRYELPDGVPHMAGMPRTAIEWALVPLLFPIHVIGEIAKPVSLSCRLFGNIFGEDMLLVGFATLGIGALSAMGLGALPFGLPIHFIFLFLTLLTSFVQAMVFSMLSTIYFLLMLPHDHGHDHDHGHGGEAHHNAH